ncbi:MAG: hypothetical protein FWF06_04195 [Symbiobacteriaceae bacterium]|nr:hypothetical protein [Symbiobacteriaceae bacterium]
MKKMFLAFLLVALISGNRVVAGAEPVDVSGDFHDPVFKGLIYEYLDKAPGAPLWDTELATVTHLYFSYSGLIIVSDLEKEGEIEEREVIRDLRGLQHLPNLELLYLDNHALTELGTLPAGLIELSCNRNFIGELPNLPDTLTVLCCRENQITSLTQLPVNLTYLDCSYNPLTELPLLPAKLVSLRVDGCELSSLPELPQSLRHINCAFNQLTNLPSLPTDFPYSLSNEATWLWLDCSNNLLSQLPILPYGLVSLDCRGNRLTELPSLVSSLASLDCSENLLITLPPLPAGMRIQELVCNDNWLTELPPLAHLPLEGIFCARNQLTAFPPLPSTLMILHASYNRLESLPNPLPRSLFELIVNNNRLTKLPPLSALTTTGGYKGLNALYCSHNLLGELPLLPSCLNDLSCGYNLLTKLPSLTATAMEYLECSGNRLIALPDLSYRTIQLDCSRNLLTSLPSLPTTLVSLNCSRNLLTTFEVTRLTRLQYIWCYDNLLSGLEAIIGLNPNQTTVIMQSPPICVAIR